MKRIAVLVLLVLAGCSKAAPSGKTDKTVGNSVEDGPPATPTETEKAVVELDAGAAQGCVPACVQRNQMKATSIENITRECETECAAPAPDPTAPPPP